MTEEERRSAPKRRKSRVVAGGVSVPIGIIVNYALLKHGVSDMPDEVKMAIFSLTGAVLSVITLCFEDFRGIIMEHIRARRMGDRRK